MASIAGMGHTSPMHPATARPKTTRMAGDVRDRVRPEPR
jgi:hypothetical protein